MPATFEVHENIRGEYRWSLNNGEGKVIAASQGYPSKDAVLAAIYAVQRLAANARIDDRTGPALVIPAARAAASSLHPLG
ncbi:MAG: YegP family protein [Actinomycetota bacterium]